MRMKFGIGIVLFVVGVLAVGPGLLDSPEPPGKTFESADIALTGSASVDGNLAIDGFTGRSSVQAFSWDITGIPSSTGGGGAGAGQATFGPLRVTKPPDVRSLGLAESAAAGRHLRTVTLTIFRPGTQQVSLTYLLSDVVVTRFEHTGRNRTMEEVEFTYNEIEVTFAPTSGEPVNFCWDITSNIGC